MADTRMSKTPGGGLRLNPPTLQIWVPGVPRPQGSMQAIVSKSTNRAFMRQSPTVVEWRNTVVAYTWDAIEEQEWEVAAEGPIHLHTEFFFARPKSHSRRRRWEDRGIKYDGSDLDKLVRAIGDALSVAGVYTDDRQVTSIAARKHYAEQPGDEGALIAVTRVALG